LFYRDFIVYSIPIDYQYYDDCTINHYCVIFYSIGLREYEIEEELVDYDIQKTAENHF